jgi:SPP1 family holin
MAQNNNGFEQVEVPKVATGLVVRTVVYLAAIVNAIAAYFGFDFNLDVDQNFVYEGVTIVALIGSFASAYWKNNDVTKKARAKAKVAKNVE